MAEAPRSCLVLGTRRAGTVLCTAHVGCWPRRCARRCARQRSGVPHDSVAPCAPAHVRNRRECTRQANRAHTYLGRRENEWHVTGDLAHIYPDFVMMAASFGVPARRVIAPSELRGAIREALDTPGPFLLDVMVPHMEHVLPMIPVRPRRCCKSVRRPVLSGRCYNGVGCCRAMHAHGGSSSGLLHRYLLGVSLLQECSLCLERTACMCLVRHCGSACAGLTSSCAVQGGGSFKDTISTGSGRDKY